VEGGVEGGVVRGGGRRGGGRGESALGEEDWDAVVLRERGKTVAGDEVLQSMLF
jgi:hypothetical protein